MNDVELAEKLAREAGAVLLQYAGKVHVSKKGARDLVTEADHASEALILAGLAAARPSDRVLAEETRAETDLAGRVWIVDPLDGTTNYVYDIPHFAVSIALSVDGRIDAGVVFNPRLGECFCAVRGGGAWLNGQSIKVRQESRLSEAVLCTGFHYRMEEKTDSNLQHFAAMASKTRGLRRLGSAALDLAYVGLGRYDGFWELHLSPWDVAAGALVAEEAGAEVSDRHGGRDWLCGGSIVAAPAPLAEAIRGVLRE
jgi:myo-inositol-1(or 4)-monophosphatase